MTAFPFKSIWVENKNRDVTFRRKERNSGYLQAENNITPPKVPNENMFSKSADSD